MNGHTVFLKKYLWKIKVPLKIQIFMWLLYKKVILTKDNLPKAVGQGAVNAFSVSNRKQLIIYLHLVHLHVWFEGLCISHIIYCLPQVSIIFLGIF
jgi:hypothetical protein